jgi:hypothetical protein
MCEAAESYRMPVEFSEISKKSILALVQDIIPPDFRRTILGQELPDEVFGSDKCHL